MEKFNELFGYNATCFNSPGAYENEILEKELHLNGIEFIDSVFVRNEHQGSGNYKKKVKYWGKKSKNNQYYLIRNAVFEPNMYENDDMILSCLKEIETAFKWGKPANISSHRINFNGGIDQAYGEKGIQKLKDLLKLIVKKWPDVEFMSSNQLGVLIKNEKNDFKLNKSV